jgi:hypothetical protein
MKALIASALLAISLSAHASDTFFLTGNKLLSWCEDSALIPICHGYIAGVVDSKMKRCPMTNATLKQLRQIVVKYAKEMPEYLHGPADVIVHSILSAAFNCEMHKKNEGVLKMM